MRTSRWFLALVSVAVALAATGLCSAQERPAERVSPAPACNANAVLWRTPAPPADAQSGDVWVNPEDAMEMVYVGPGEFTMGTSDAQLAAWVKAHPGDRPELFRSEQPQFRANLNGYWIGRTEVTNAQYRRFVRATGHHPPTYWTAWKEGELPASLDNFPVVMVDWEDARAYCEWAGGHLPTEPQWEKAARGADARIFPWGNEWDAARCRNFDAIAGAPATAGAVEARALVLEWLKNHDPVREGAAAVGSYPGGASPYGCLDMAGNVDEWCADWYDPGVYQRYARGDMRPPAVGRYRVLRGGSWYSVNPRCFRCAYRNCRRCTRLLQFNGFRCARAAAQ